MTDHTDHATNSTRTPATTERPWESGIRRGRDTIEVAAQDAAEARYTPQPARRERVLPRLPVRHDRLVPAYHDRIGRAYL